MVAEYMGEPMLSALVKKAIILLPSYHHCILKLVKTIPKKTSNKDSSHRSFKKANSLSKLEDSEMVLGDVYFIF